MDKNRKPNFMALLPIFVFLGLTGGFGIALGSSSVIDALLFFMISAFVAIIMTKDKPIMDRIDLFSKAAANPNTIIMILIFLLAGAFSAVARDGGAVNSVVNLFLTFIPNNFLVSGVFAISCLVAVSLGTSIGTVVAVAPIAVGLAEATGLPVALVVGAAVGGAAFGDNMSVISDTTIAATRICGVKMTDKAKVNFLIILPAAIATMAIFYYITRGTTFDFTPGEYNLFQVIPFAAVLITALAGLNVFYVLFFGILLAGGIGMYFGSFTSPEGYGQFITLLQTIHSGMMGMTKISIIVVIISGIIGMMKYNGGIDWIVQKLEERVKTKKGGVLSIALLSMIITVFVAGSTVAIVTAAPLAMETTDKYNIDPRKTASYLDIFATATMVNVPWGGVLLAASAAATTAMSSGAVDAVELIKYSTYSHFVFICAFLSIYFDFPRLKPLAEDQKVNPIAAEDIVDVV